MDVRTLAGLTGTQKPALDRVNAKLQAAIAGLVSGTKRAADNIAELSIATQLQSQTTTLRQASNNLAQASSLTQVADGGAEQIGDILEKMNALASQASNPVLNADNRRQLNEQFQQLKSAIDRFAENTSFNGKKLLDGSMSGDNALSLTQLVAGESGEDAHALSIPSLSASSLFHGQNPDLLSADNAAQAAAAIGGALGRVTGARSAIGAFQQSANYAAASIETAAANQEAARAILQDADIAEASTQFSLLELQRNASLALAAQGNRLSPALLKLVS